MTISGWILYTNPLIIVERQNLVLMAAFLAIARLTFTHGILLPTESKL